MKPLAIDLYCGKGGWARGLIAEGWRVVGVDNNPDFASDYPGEFICADLLTWLGWIGYRPRLVVASPPCEEFSRWGMPWTRAKNPPPPDLSHVNRSFALAGLWRVPIVLENVNAAQGWLGKSALNCGPFHLWGDVPALCPIFAGRPKESYSSTARAERAMIPENLARWIARCHQPRQGRKASYK